MYCWFDRRTPIQAPALSSKPAFEQYASQFTVPLFPVFTKTLTPFTLPQALKDFVHERVAEKAYSNPSDYVRALIREAVRHMQRRPGKILNVASTAGITSRMTGLNATRK